MQMDMRPGYRQEMKLTPKMFLSLHVLQLNIMELGIFMRAELEENPLLEEEASGEVPSEDEAMINKDLSMLVDDDLEGEELFPSGKRPSGLISEKKRRYFETLITKRESLQDHLLWQLEILAENDEEKRIGEFIIGNLDNNGFLTMEPEQMREKIGVNTKSFKRALSLIRTFDPAGVGAHDVKESLLIQLILSGKKNTKLYKIVYSYLEDLEKGDYGKIADACLINKKDVLKAKRRISYLNPKPGASITADEMPASIIPDVFFIETNGIYKIEVNEEELPKLKIGPLKAFDAKTGCRKAFLERGYHKQSCFQ